MRNYADEIALMLSSVSEDKELLLTVMGAVKYPRPERQWEVVTLALDKPIILGLSGGTASAALTFFGYGPYVLVGLLAGIVLTGFFLAVSAVLQLAK